MVKHKTETDPLTGLLSRKTFEALFTSTFDEAKSKQRPLSLSFLDIDDFKKINDALGDAAGDSTIIRVADTIRALTGRDTISGRYGGDEFAILFPSTEREQAFLALERIRSEIEKLQTIEVQGQQLNMKVSISGGVAAYPIDGRNEREILRNADQAIYRAKGTGRNKICLSHEERMVTKTTHYTPTQLERLVKLSHDLNVGEADLLREAMDDLLIKYEVTDPFSR